MSNPSQDVIVGLDAGSDQIRCVVGECLEVDRPYAARHDTPTIKLLGVGTCKSEGIQHGMVTDINAAANAIRQAVAEAQATAEFKELPPMIVAVGGKSLYSLNCQGKVAVRRDTVSKADMEDAYQSARQNLMGEEVRRGRSGKEIKLLERYWLCGDTKTHTPLHLSSEYLTFCGHAIYGSEAGARNMIQAMTSGGVMVEDYLPHPYASALSVLRPEEMNTGALLIDMGRDTTSVCLFANGNVEMSAVFGFGASIFTDDLSVFFGINQLDAEALKRQVSACVTVGESKTYLTLPHHPVPRPFAQEQVIKTLQARSHEVVETIIRNLDPEVLRLARSVVVTGGGSELVSFVDAVESGFNAPGVAGSVMHRPVRAGVAHSFMSGHSYGPSMSAALGLLSWSAQQRQNQLKTGRSNPKKSSLWKVAKRIFTFNYA